MEMRQPRKYDYVSVHVRLDRDVPRRIRARVQEVSRFALWALTVALALIATSAGWAGKSQVEFRVYDPTGVVRTEVTESDVVRSSVHALRVGGSTTLYVGLTKIGASKFHTLTRALAGWTCRAFSSPSRSGSQS